MSQACYSFILRHKTTEPTDIVQALLFDTRKRAGGRELKVLCAILAAALLAAGATVAQPETPIGSEALSVEDQAFITKEWTWSAGTTTTNFTAYGPSEQVNQLDPQNDPLECQGCELASSIHFEPDDEFQPVPSSR